jgi:cGMP-dependent protein kinase 2
MSNANQTHDVRIKNYAPLEIVVSEGDAQDFFYVILDGTVEVSQNRKTIRTLREGDVFGIENYYRKRPYTTTACAITPARIAAYRSETIRDIIYTHPQLAEQIFASVMCQLEQTTGRAEENIPFEHATLIREHVYKDGEIIIKENTEGNEMFRLIEAQHGLRVTFKGLEIGTITRPGEFFGEMGPILHQPRSATVTSIGRSRVQIFMIEDIEDDFKQFPDLAISIINTLSKRLFETDMRLAKQIPAKPGFIGRPEKSS